jgi:hypothetical protein
VDDEAEVGEPAAGVGGNGGMTYLLRSLEHGQCFVDTDRSLLRVTNQRPIATRPPPNRIKSRATSTRCIAGPSRFTDPLVLFVTTPPGDDTKPRGPVWHAAVRLVALIAERVIGGAFRRLDIGGSWIEQAILNQDAYERHDGSWRFARRRHLLWYGIDLPERPFDQPKTGWPATATGRGSLPEEFEAWRTFYGITQPPSGYYGQPEMGSTFLR